jgi:putative nucleotidyltransferase with HDIG domain
MKAIESILKESNALPSLPAVVIELQKCLDADNTGAKQLAEKISRDQALSAKTLRLANSPFYSMQCAVSTIKQAVSVLGFDSVRTMVTTAGIVNAFVASQLPKEFDFENFWRHSLATGMCAKTLARFCDVDPDQAFMAGLMHDIGKLVLARAHPEKFMEAIRYAEAQSCPISKAEKAMFDFDHAAVGAQLAKTWNFPVAIQRAIEEHESPSMPQERNSLVALIHVANALVITYELGRTDSEAIPDQKFSNPIWNEMGESDDLLLQVAEETRARIKDVCASLLTH